MTKKIDLLQKVLASTYGLMIKAQNYHWNVEGREFLSLHELFEKEYKDLFQAIDLIAERIRVFDEKAHASLNEYNKLSVIRDGNENYSEEEMIRDLLNSHKEMVALLYKTLKQCANDNDEITESIIADRIEIHEKDEWILRALLAS